MLHLQNILASIVNSALQAYSQLCLLFSKITGQTVNHKILQLKNLKKIEVTSTLYWRRRWHPIPVLLPGKPHGWRSLIGYSPWGRKESDTTERLHFTSLPLLGCLAGYPLQLWGCDLERNKGFQVVSFLKGYFFSSFYNGCIDPPRTRVLQTGLLNTERPLSHVHYKQSNQQVSSSHLDRLT